MFLGCVFLKSNKTFGRVYFADLAGSGLSGLVFLGAMYVFPPVDLIAAPLALWAASCLPWSFLPGARRALAPFVVSAVVAFGGHFVVAPELGLSRLAVNDYKGASYARRLPEAKKVYESWSPFGFLEAYSTSYLHFAPGLSDNAGFNLPEMPANAYLGLYIDSDGPIGVMRHLTTKEAAYFHYLPMDYPYVIKKAPKTFVVQFGGGISTEVALSSGSKDVTVAEGNRAILEAFRSPVFRNFTDDILSKVRVVDYEGRHFLAQTNEKFDVIDLSLADSTGLSNPGGFAVVEKFAYTEEAMETYMRALADGGVLAVTIWNKEEPPKSVLKLYATMAAASRALDGDRMAELVLRRLVLPLDRDRALQARRLLRRRDRDAAQAFARPVVRRDLFAGLLLRRLADRSHARRLCRAVLLRAGQRSAGRGRPRRRPTSTRPRRPTTRPARRRAAAGRPDEGALPSTVMGRLAWHTLVNGGWGEIAARYVFNTRKLTNDAPYFAAYVKTKDLPQVLFDPDRLEPLQDEWGYLLIWATLGVACVAAAALLAIPVLWGWRTIFAKTPGKALSVVYFACLGAGYIMVEVGLIAHFVMALGNPTVSASILITGMLVFSGLGALVSERILPIMRVFMPALFLAIGALLIGYAFFLNTALDAIGALPYLARLAFCFAFIAPPAFLMGFPMPTAMTTLGRLGKEHLFIWAWGVNGCFSVIGAAAAPVIATNFGLGSVIEIAGCAYLLALPAFFGVISGSGATPRRMSRRLKETEVPR